MLPTIPPPSEPLGNLFEEIFDRLHSGQEVPLEEYIDRHPEYADLIQNGDASAG